MPLKVEIDDRSGFCGGVIRAIGSAERYLDSHPGQRLYSLGDIVHNEEELSRLASKGLVTVSGLDGEVPSGGTVLIRAHGEPPSTYEKARGKGLILIDCTCPVVLALQKSIREAWKSLAPRGGQLLIFGKVGHPEVLGLVGQTGGKAVVVEDLDMLGRLLGEGGALRRDVPTEIFSQTTKSPREYARICSVLESEIPLTVVHGTVCSQVGSRHEALGSFAAAHDVIVFVSGRSSSNGKVLFDLCRSVNPRTWMVGNASQIDPFWLEGAATVGVCGATSTPKWLLEEVAAALENLAL